MKESRRIGTTSLRLEIFILDSTSTTGQGKTGLLFNTASLTAYYKRNTDATATAITLATATLGTYTSGGFKEVDATNMPGVYEFDPPNAALASGADSVVFMLKGATGMVPVLLEVELTATTNQLAMQLQKNVAYAGFQFVMLDVNGAGKTGLTVTATRSLDAGGFSACANAVTEIANGWYTIDLAAADTNGKDIALNFTATGALDTKLKYTSQP